MAESPRPQARSYLTLQTLEALTASIPSSRIRLNCIEVSTNYIILGANTGSLYVFDRDTSRFVQLLTVDGLQHSISLVKFSLDEKYLAVVLSKNPVIYVMEFNLKVRKSEKVRVVSCPFCEVCIVG